MGFRFRKSINLGGGFRINLSKSGIGYSFGTKGFRVTKKAKGGTRYTASIPGTGISYVEETGKKSQSRSNAENNHNCKSSVHSQPVEYEIKHCDTVELSNSNIDNVFSEGLEEMIASANRSYKYNRWSTIGIIVFLILSTAYPIFLLATCICVALKIYVLKNGKIELEYTIDEDQRAIIDERIKSFQKIAKSKKIWNITQSSKIIDSKHACGADTGIMRVPCKSTTKLPFPFVSNEDALCFKYKNETLIFLPDKFFIIKGGKIGALNYCDVTSTISSIRFVESQGVPSDAKVVGKTWLYVNKSGGPDKRYKDNREFPMCLYGELTLRSSNGNINTVLMFSKFDI